MGADVAFFGQCQETLHSLTNLEFPNRKFHNPSSGPKLHGVQHQEQDKWVQMLPFFGQCQETLQSLTNFEWPNRKFHNPSTGIPRFTLLIWGPKRKTAAAKTA